MAGCPRSARRAAAILAASPAHVRWQVAVAGRRTDRAALRHETDAAPRPFIGPKSRNVGTVECDRTAGDRILADHRAQQAGLADAVAAEHARHLAGFSRERDAAQRLR